MIDLGTRPHRRHFAGMSSQVTIVTATGEQLRALRQRFKKTNPKYDDSFGPQAFDHPTSFGKLIGWRAIGHAASVWQHLRQSLLTLIDEKKQDWEAKREKSGGGPSEPLFLLQCFLLGVDEHHASPHVCILCDLKWFSTAIRSIIISSKLLSANGWGCIRLPYSVALLASGATPQGFSWGSRSEQFSEYRVFANDGDLVRGYLNGIPIEVYKHGEKIGEASIGGIICAEGDIFAVTVAHVFDDGRSSTPLAEAGCDELLFDIDEDELDIFARDSTVVESHPQYGAEWIRSFRDQRDRIDNPVTVNSSTGLEPKASSSSREGKSVMIGHLYELPQSKTSDWAVVKLTWSKELRHRNLLPHIPDAKGLTLFSPSGTRHGFAASGGILSSGFPPKPRQVVIMSMSESSPVVGDCGSWSFQWDRHDFVGMLVASCGALRECYLTSLDEVIQDIRAQSDLPFTLSQIETPTFLEDQEGVSAREAAISPLVWRSIPRGPNVPVAEVESPHLGRHSGSGSVISHYISNPISDGVSNNQGVKRSRSPEDYDDTNQPSLAGDDDDGLRKRGRPMTKIKSEMPIPPPVPPMQQQQALPSQTPQLQYTSTQAAPTPMATPTKSTPKALPMVRDYKMDQLGPGGDEYLPRDIDEAGEKKILPNGQLVGGREYRCRTFLVPNRGDKLFMLAMECARVLGYRDSSLLFNKGKPLFKIIANQVEKDALVSQEILPFEYRSHQISIVTARSMFRQFGSRIITNGRRVRDDYWETKARKQGFTEADLAREKKPHPSKARNAAAADANQNPFLGAPHGEIVHTNTPGQFGGPPQTFASDGFYPQPPQQSYLQLNTTLAEASMTPLPSEPYLSMTLPSAQKQPLASALAHSESSDRVRPRSNPWTADSNLGSD